MRSDGPGRQTTPQCPSRLLLCVGAGTSVPPLWAEKVLFPPLSGPRAAVLSSLGWGQEAPSWLTLTPRA